MMMANALMLRAATLPAYVKSWWRGPGPVIPTSHGLLAASMPWNWWQLGISPLPHQPNPTVAACVSAYAQTIASLPVNHWRDLPNGGRERVINSAATRVMRRPNGYQTRADFLVNLISTELYEGNGIAFATRNGRDEIDALHIAGPHLTQPMVDPDSREVFYAIADNGLVPPRRAEVRLEDNWSFAVAQRDALHLRINCPEHPLKGVSPITAAAMAVATGNSIGAHHATFFQNFSRPSGVLQTDTQLTSKQMAELREQWEQLSANSGAGRVPILGWGLKWQPTSFSSQDSQIIETQKMTVAEIARVFRVPLPVIGQMEGVTVANTEQLISNWLSTGLGFMVEHIEQALDVLFELPPGEYLEFDMDALMRPDFVARVDGLTKGITGGLFAPNEARQRMGLPRAKAGDSPRVQAQVVPLENALATPTPSAPSAPAAPAAPTAADE
ncbi:phage portal protein [Cupriavidus sp. SS-3]|uniref:phage portal protein n=1 Tax=Cupriavidus sp. SS-3 TaxID=3109596 RepID=UPI002DB693E5|nr:phage portal protein [Cupriavidus sp. SS-3]MEC3769057.1 phage portal protein [Cupriavidus sp. SS-3]